MNTETLSALRRHISNAVLPSRSGDCGSTVVKVLCYKSEGRWFDPSWCQWIFHFSHYGPGVDSASNRNEYQENFLGVRKADNLTTILCRCQEIWEP